MAGFFSTLAEKLAERWLAVLTLPGVAFLSGVWIARALGHAQALDVQALADAAERTLAEVSTWSGIGQALGVLAVAAAATGVGLVIRGLSGATRWFWLDEAVNRPRLSRTTAWRSARLQRRWHELIASRHSERQAAKQHSQAVTQSEPDRAVAVAAHRAAMRISMAPPARATWMGNRIHALQHSLKQHYDLDLYWVWPRLWIVLPTGVRENLTTADAAFRYAAVRATWALPWLILALWWWPALPVAIVLAVGGWRAGREAIETLAQLTEAAADTYGPTLAVQLGLTSEPKELTVETGREISRIARKKR